MSEMLLKEMDEVSLSQPSNKEEKLEKEDERSFLLVDENETLKVSGANITLS